MIKLIKFIAKKWCFLNRKEKRNKKSELNILNDLVTVINQYFPELIKKFNGLTDLRNQSYVKYQMKVIFIVRLMGLYMITKLIRGKIIQKYKIRDKYYHVIVDGTGLATSRKKSNSNKSTLSNDTNSPHT